jgi:hypothetical protein
VVIVVASGKWILLEQSKANQCACISARGGIAPKQGRTNPMKTSESPVIEYVFEYIGIYSHSSDELSSFDSSLLYVSSDSVPEKK